MKYCSINYFPFSVPGSRSPLLLMRVMAAVLFASVALNVRAQVFKADVIAGTNLSQVDGDEAFGFKKLGLTGGLGVVAPLYKNWSLSLETLFSQKGSRQGARFADSLDGSYRLKLNYAEVPFMIQYTDRNVVSAGAGVSWNRLVYAGEWRNNRRIDSVSVLSGVFDRNDWLAFADVRVRLYRNLIFNARYSYSLGKIATRTIIDSESGKPNVRDFYNNLWSFRLLYVINEKQEYGKKSRKSEPGGQ